MRDTIIAIHYEKGIGSPDFVFPLTFDLKHEGEQWTGMCLEFGTSTFGDTLDEVIPIMDKQRVNVVRRGWNWWG